MDIFEDIQTFAAVSYIPVVVPGKPERSLPALLRDRYLQRLQGTCERFQCRFGEQEVNMLGHEDVAIEVEPVIFLGACKGLQELTASRIRIQVGQPVVATEGDEVVLTID